MRPHLVGLATAMTLASLAPCTRAQTPRAMAQALFDEAMRLMNDKAYDHACPKLEEVARLQPGKIGVRLELGACYEGSGKLVSAWERYREAAALAHAANDERASAADEKVRSLWSRLPHLMVPTLVDAGGPALEASAQVTVSLQPAVPSAPVVASAPSPPVEDAASPSPVSAPVAGASRGSVQRTLGLVAAGVGLAGLTVGVVFETVNGTNGCISGMNLSDACITNQSVAIASFVAGGALGAAGVVIYLTAPNRESAKTAWLSPMTGGARGLVVGGTF